MLLVHIRIQGFTNLPPMRSRRYRERLSKAAYFVIHTGTRVMENRRSRETYGKRERERERGRKRRCERWRTRQTSEDNKVHEFPKKKWGNVSPRNYLMPRPRVSLTKYHAQEKPRWFRREISSVTIDISCRSRNNYWNHLLTAHVCFFMRSLLSRNRVHVPLSTVINRFYFGTKLFRAQH